MLPGSNKANMSVGASDQPACWTPGLVLVVANFEDKINKPQAGRHHSTRVCRKLRKTILLTKFHKLLVHCVGDIAVANVIIWINIILLVGKNRVERFIVEQPGYFGTVRGKLDHSLRQEREQRRRYRVLRRCRSGLREDG